MCNKKEKVYEAGKYPALRDIPIKHGTVEDKNKSKCQKVTEPEKALASIVARTAGKTEDLLSEYLGEAEKDASPTIGTTGP